MRVGRRPDDQSIDGRVAERIFRIERPGDTVLVAERRRSSLDGIDDEGQLGLRVLGDRTGVDLAHPASTEHRDPDHRVVPPRQGVQVRGTGSVTTTR